MQILNRSVHPQLHITTWEIKPLQLILKHNCIQKINLLSNNMQSADVHKIVEKSHSTSTRSRLCQRARCLVC